MKRVLVFVLLSLMLSSIHAIPINHNATLIPTKTSLISGGFNGNLGAITLEYTHGLNNTNLHAKLNMGGGTVNLQTSMRHCILDWKNIDMGFGYGAELSLRTAGGWWEFSPLAMWNMSHNFREHIDFYGGFLFAFDIGSAWGTAFTDVDFNMYYGTQIDLIKNLELYIELQTSIASGANGSFIGVNYYLPRGVELPEKK